MSSAFLFDARSPQVIANFSEVISSLLIKAAALNNFVHAVRYEIANGTTGRNPVSNFRRGYVDCSLHNRIRMVGGFTGPVQDDELDDFLQVAEAMPFS